jgi:hypothetical protein
MTGALYLKISASTAHKKSRHEMSEYVIKNTDYFFDVLQLCFKVTDKNHHKACWILELVALKKIALFTLFTTYITSNLHLLTNESSKRSMSGIVLQLMTAFDKYKKLELSEIELEQITAASFDWLIGNAKVATKAHAMKLLYLVGKYDDWIYPELQIIFLKDASKHSIGYKACAKTILQKIK